MSREQGHDENKAKGGEIVKVLIALIAVVAVAIIALHTIRTAEKEISRHRESDND